ncbi:hypothetical protein NBRGN_062_01900 [Nocardia brasiliensis NBRC 14402]|uniref:hypothetical protein n=1 Tax=Nocardia brasiliensis TaxID=37326 RepID=UPI00031CD474|nr:hypothetical protein [Nocardia brasiliensis]ASF10976.1 hypothetical protein CEQ30_30620 [Nocardia brasiliensis]GAJ83351.1 hypothetical protein NBRGN_062_01900 [Nocardia brasiliensis NBRC 14402]SUB10375.1 Uncharacterised protein [Nocardia brasiliensis]
MSAELAEQQAALVRALVAGAPVPAGFDRAAVAAAAHALLRKRADEVARRFPMLAQACGPDYRERFLAWADGRPKTSTAADAAAFAAYLGLPAPSGTTAKRWPRH